MIGSKFFITFIAFIVVIFAIYKFDITENFFLNTPMTYKVDRVNESKGDMFSIPGTYQSMLSPRFSNLNYGAYIKYNMPSIANQGVPCNPLTFNNMVQTKNQVKENFCYKCGDSCKNSPACAKGGLSSMDMKSTNGINWSDEQMYPNKNYSNAMNSLNYTDTTDMIPVGDMQTENALGGPQQAIIYDRFMFANQRSRLYALGDPIRGDLPIVPCKNEWFRPSVHPHIDLRDGALSIMGGVHNETSKDLHELQNLTSGGVYNTLGGVHYSLQSMNNSTQKSSMLGAGQRDLEVTAFP